MAEQGRSLRITRAAKKKAATAAEEHAPATKKRVVLGDLPNLSNIVVGAEGEGNANVKPKPPQPKAVRGKVKKPAAESTASSGPLSDPSLESGDVDSKNDVEPASDDPQMCRAYEAEYVDPKIDVEPASNEADINESGDVDPKIDVEPASDGDVDLRADEDPRAYEADSDESGEVDLRAYEADSDESGEVDFRADEDPRAYEAEDPDLRAYEDPRAYEADIDEYLHNMEVSAYAADIYENLREMEPHRRPLPNYIEEVQQDVTANMRGMLVDRLIKFADEYKLPPDTLYLSISYIDRFLSLNALNWQKLQLLGVSAMLIAWKYEMNSPAHVGDFCNITDDTFTKEDVVKMESDILKSLMFMMGNPTIMSFLIRFNRIDQEDYKTNSHFQLKFLGYYLAELS